MLQGGITYRMSGNTTSCATLSSVVPHGPPERPAAGPSLAHRSTAQDGPGSFGTVDSHCEGGADLAHSRVAHAAQPADEDRDRDAFDRVEVHRRPAGHRVVTRFEHDFADEPSNRRRTRRDECATMSRDHRVAGQDDDWSTTDLGHLAPPHLPARRECI